jgi:Zn-dependent M28 family amino/carboxypeptidase
VALPAAILLDLEQGWPVFSWLHAEQQHHVSATVPAAGEAAPRLLVTAHYDTQTDLLDHVERAPVEAASLPVTLLMLLAAALGWLGPRRRRGVERARRVLVGATPWLALGFGAAFFATLSGGAFLRERSPGALDDGGACAVALRLAERIAREPLARTELEVLLLSGEEVGTQGALVLARERYTSPPRLPTAVLNLEILGAAPDLAALASERFTLRSFGADPRLLALADEVHRERRGTPLHLAGGGVTDARAFLARGIPALTLVSDAPGHPAARGLHSAADLRSRLDEAALDEHLAFLEDLARRIDRSGP